MTFERLLPLIGDIPHMPPERGKIIYDFVRSAKPLSVLELGFAHGTSSCYMAAALEENGGGSILTLDHLRARDRRPNIEELLERTGLGAFVEPRFCRRSYTWELLKLLERNTAEGVTTPVFDFVFIDGGHTWDSDGFSFLLADRLLRPGGWVLFDDMQWMPIDSAGEAWVDEMPEEERSVAHIDKVFQLLVVPHGSYGEFRIDGTWGWARKTGSGSFAPPPSAILQDIYRSSASARRMMRLRRYIRKAFGRG